MEEGVERIGLCEYYLILPKNAINLQALYGKCTEVMTHLPNREITTPTYIYVNRVQCCPKRTQYAGTLRQMYESEDVFAHQRIYYPKVARCKYAVILSKTDPNCKHCTANDGKKGIGSYIAHTASNIMIQSTLQQMKGIGNSL